ncbi:MAG: OmpH family outer membrane protein [Candidatus Eisenbacteria sp.]|nr:OmpH family outer membrane protein [Candidatus Eisenbacteria bacterium]
MRRYLLTLAVASALVMFASVGAWCAEAVGYVNSEQLRLEYVGAGDLDAQLEASVADWRTQAREKEQEMEGLIVELQNQRLLLSEEAAGEKEMAIQRKQLEFEEFLNNVWGAGGLAAQREAELWQPVFDRVNGILESIGVEGEYVMIFDAARMGIVYAAPSADLTQEVLDKLNGTEE